MKPDNKNFILAAGLSFLILLLYPVYLKWVSPPPAPAPQVSSELTSADHQIPNQPVINDTVGSVSGVPKVVENENLYHFSNNHFNVEFSDHGATVTKLALTQWGKKIKGSEAILINREETGVGSFSLALPGQGLDFENKTFSLERLDALHGEIAFSAQEPGKWLIRKIYRFDPITPTFWLETEIENLSPSQQTGSVQLTNYFVVGSDTTHQHESESFVSLRDKLVSAKFDKVKKKPSLIEDHILWQALTRHFFTLIIRPDSPAALSKTTVENGTVFKSDLQLKPETIEPNQKIGHQFLIYSGPKYYRVLKSFDHGFEHILSYGFFGIFKLWLLVALQWTYQVTGNYGWAIILITCAIKLLFTPLTHMSFESMKKMQALQPKLKLLQEQHKSDQAKLSKEMMELYKRNKVNPMSGCLPMVLQIPVFIAFYQVLAQTAEFQGEPFIGWIRDLSEPDRAFVLPFVIPFLGEAINILPILMLGSMVWQQKLTPQTAGSPEQQKMMMFMPIIFGFIFYKLPSGLVLYWFVNNMLSIFHQLFVKGKALPHHEENG